MARVLMLCLAHCPPRAPQADGAAAAGRLDTLEWLWERLGGNPEAIVWRNSVGAAANAGQRSVVEWLLDRRCTVHGSCIMTAAEGGHVDVVKLLWKRVGLDQSYHADLAAWSAESGSLTLLQWIVEHTLPLTNKACASTAQCNHLDALRFLRRHHCPWDGWTLRAAALLWPPGHPAVGPGQWVSLDGGG